MTARKTKHKKSSSKRRKTSVSERSSREVVSIDRAVVPEPVTDVITEKTYIRTEPEVEIRKPATLSQALTEPAVVVVKPRTKVVRKEIEAKTRRRA